MRRAVKRCTQTPATCIPILRCFWRRRRKVNIGILGTGDVGRALGRGFVALGHKVMMGARAAGNERAGAFVAEAGPNAAQGTFADAARFGEIVVLATLGSANEAALGQAGVENLAGKLVLDTTNPLDFSQGMPPRLFVGHTDSGGERVQRMLPKSNVVKVWNTVGYAHMFRPDFPGGPPDMFIAGNDSAAKQQVAKLLADFGWNTVDSGGIESSRYLEGMCMVWVLHGAATGSWNHAFKLLHK
jgi:predicted dinucleotide-binding enzyme